MGQKRGNKQRLFTLTPEAHAVLDRVPKGMASAWVSGLVVRMEGEVEDMRLEATEGLWKATAVARRKRAQKNPLATARAKREKCEREDAAYAEACAQIVAEYCRKVEERGGG